LQSPLEPYITSGCPSANVLRDYPNANVRRSPNASVRRDYPSANVRRGPGYPSASAALDPRGR